jgi:hypothetical protein
MDGMSVPEHPSVVRAIRPSEDAPQPVNEGKHRVAGKGLNNKRVTSAFTGESGNIRSQLQMLHRQYQPLGYDLPWETLDYVEILSRYNPDFSQAVENMKMLANSGHTLMVDAGSDLQRRKTKDFLEGKASKIQESHGGVDGLISKLMDQAAVYGAMCGEWVLNETLTEVIDFVDLSPKRIRFFWEEADQRFAPYQKVSRAQAVEAQKAGQVVRNGDCVKLNEQTFMYHAFDSQSESPYGTPPFLASLANIAIQRDIVFNMAQIVKKIGILGIVDLAIERMQPLPNEDEDKLAARKATYLDEMVTAGEDMMREGGIVHFDDVKVTTQQMGGNAAGATNIHKANEEMVFSGLKSMPSVQGRSYSTTETYAGVAYDIIIRNTFKYQRGAKRFIERGYWLMATLGGFQPKSIKIQFAENRSLNRLQEAQAEAAEIKNVAMKWLLGFIDQEQGAQELGYSEPKTPMEAVPDVIGGALAAHGVDTPFQTNLGASVLESLEGSDTDDHDVATGSDIGVPSKSPAKMEDEDDDEDA